MNIISNVTFIITQPGADEHTATGTRGPFDIQVFTYPVTNLKRFGDVKKVYSIGTGSRIDMRRLTNYMFQKFGYYQMPTPMHLYRNKGRYAFLRLNAPLSLIENIIETELDFHTGERKCMRPENDAYLKFYLNNRWAGFGPGFMEEMRPRAVKK